MEFQNDSFCGREPAELLQDPTVRQLLSKLLQLDPDLLHQAAALAAAGRPDAARQLILPRLEQPELRDRKAGNPDG